MNFSLTTFNKTGKLMQIEYALARVQQGKMALGIKGENIDRSLERYKDPLTFLLSIAKNGVVIATDRKVSSVLVDSDEYQKIQSITPTTGLFSLLHFAFCSITSKHILLQDLYTLVWGPISE